MPTRANRSEPGFKRQVVIRVGADDWQLLQQAAEEHGSYQAALITGLRALTKPRIDTARAEAKAPSKPKPPSAPAPLAIVPPISLDEEIRAREAAKLLGLKTSTVTGYIRSGRMPGRYDDPPTWLGWVTTRRAVEDYRKRLLKPSLDRGRGPRW